ncbi:MAG: 23S rRNA (adenine(2503)-C(2))-methyltransferase RlmN [Bacteroidota bacterium]|nr:23S rRNA (adenine(2503)-C(2))-methyltransferase RlmN [Bacteroidota bacterium]
MKNIRSYNIEQLEKLMEELGERSDSLRRARRIYNYLWKKNISAFDEIEELPQYIIEHLKEYYILAKVSIHSQQKSSDGTIKYALKLYDGNIVEGVLIPTETRMTACISSQVGCSLTCKFCATGKMERVRNLDYWEIYDQVFIIKEQALLHYNMDLTNIVYMGMGEPLLNYDNVLKSTVMCISNDGLGLSHNRITVSTAGIAKMIKKLADDDVKFNLAVSLHAPNDEKRSHMMPINDSNNLQVLEEALLYFCNKTEEKVMLEYIVFNNFNDNPEDAEELSSFSQRVPSKINLIEYNSIGDNEFVNSAEDRLKIFKDILYKNKCTVMTRRSRGKDIDAACGQLANK